MIPGGKNPDWGRRTSRPAAAPGRRRPGRVKSADAKLRKALAKGLNVRVRVPGAGRLSAAATKGSGRKVAAGSKSVKGGNATVKLRFTKAAKRSLKRAAQREGAHQGRVQAGRRRGAAHPVSLTLKR